MYICVTQKHNICTCGGLLGVHFFSPEPAPEPTCEPTFRAVGVEVFHKDILHTLVGSVILNRVAILP